jgi:predicted nucleic acid-binding protein
VWIAARRDDRIYEELASLMDADEAAMALPVRLELLAGTPKKERTAFHKSCGAVPQLVPTEETWKPLAAWIERATDAGESFSLTDLLIASLADEIGGLIWSLDHDFERMEKLRIARMFR